MGVCHGHGRDYRRSLGNGAAAVQLTQDSQGWSWGKRVHKTRCAKKTELSPFSYWKKNTNNVRKTFILVLFKAPFVEASHAAIVIKYNIMYVTGTKHRRSKIKVACFNCKKIMYKQNNDQIYDQIRLCKCGLHQVTSGLVRSENETWSSAGTTQSFKKALCCALFYKKHTLYNFSI